MTNWLRSILPREEKFFPLFDAHAEHIARGAAQLQAILANPGESAPFDQLERTIAEGDKLNRQVLERLRASFVVPFDRADIKEMTVAMQAALKAMMGAATARRSPRLDGAASLLPPFGERIVALGDNVRQAIPLLEALDRNTEQLHQICQRIGDGYAALVEQRDAAMMQLFDGGSDPVAMLAAVRLLERVTMVAERLDGVADRIDDLVLDYV
ncbi:DUF47 family protein [Sphingomonas sp.]|uniref:DUF47 domain-containing protein n=1 Tax=Sphingomonas sp. TaxID=28214 RepID=UPI0028AEAB75|nr:DUF47 family protein [Sphingomonas sp.]